MFFVSAPPPPPPFSFQVESGKGLTVYAAGIPIIVGSSIQFYKPDWSKGYYSSTNSNQTITKIDGATVREEFKSDGGLANGTITYHAVGDQLKIHYELRWDGDAPANVELNSGFLWAPAFERGQLTADGKPTRPLNSYLYSGTGIETRRYSADASDYQFNSPEGVVMEHSSVPLTLFDGRGYGEDWAKGKNLFWLGNLGIPLIKGASSTLDVVYSFDITERDLTNNTVANLATVANPATVVPDSGHPLLIPKPERAHLDWNHPLVYSGKFVYPAGEPDLRHFTTELSRRFQLPLPTPASKPIAIDGGVSKMGLVPGGYSISITDHSISVLGEEDEGYANGLLRLAQLAYAQNGKLVFPTGSIVDQPRTKWRGVHLFVGNQANEFQRKLWDRVLRPLLFNKVVLQCERTQWTSLPGISTPITMSKSDLVNLFEFYRSIGVDPIPLIESYGHMEWLFANNKNLDLAMDPKDPYAVNPENPKAAETLKSLWEEVVQTLHPDTVHFGLDEVDMRGAKVDAGTKTRLWAKQLELLDSIAKSNKVDMMIWGDQALAPGEAPDAALAETKDDSAARRAAIPKGTLIGDWHYLSDENSTDYRDVLQLWKDSKTPPIASTWYSPQNIAGFDREAGLLGCGTLQTTWCGYESNEATMLEAFDQFTAMVLAADYGWSGRKESPSELDYDPASIFRKMYFSDPAPLAPKPGVSLAPENSVAPQFQVGNVTFSHPFLQSLGSTIVEAERGNKSLIFHANAVATHVYIACNTLEPGSDSGVPVCDVQLNFADGTHLEKIVSYGLEVRSESDKAPITLSERNQEGIGCLEINLGKQPKTLTSIAFRPLNPYTGFVIRGVETTK